MLSAQGPGHEFGAAVCGMTADQPGQWIAQPGVRVDAGELDTGKNLTKGLGYGDGTKGGRPALRPRGNVQGTCGSGST